MKRKNLQFISIIAALLFLVTVKYSYSQWTIAGALSNLGITNPSPAVSVVDRNIVWIVGGETTPAVYRTTNAGTNWITVPTTGIALNLYTVWALDANTAFVADGGNPGGTTGGDATFYKTTNAGTNWTVVGHTSGTAGFFNGIAFSRTEPTFGIAESDPPNGAGTPYYLSKTTDGGATWTVTNPPGYPGIASSVNSVVAVSHSFYGWGSNASPPSFIVTSDGGTTWNKRNSSITGTFTSGIAFKDASIGILASSTSLPSISRTTNGGVTWTTVSTGTTVGGLCTMKWVDATNTCYLSGATGPAGCVSKSTNGGLNWTTMTTSGLTGISHMDFERNGTIVYGFAITSSGAVLKLTDNVTEVISTNSLIPTEYKLEQNYPNPFNPSTTINFSIPSASKVTLKVYDALGKEVATLADEFKAAGNYSTNFNAGSNLNSGIYFYTITAGNYVNTKKFVLIK